MAAAVAAVAAAAGAAREGGAAVSRRTPGEGGARVLRVVRGQQAPPRVLGHAGSEQPAADVGVGPGARELVAVPPAVGRRVRGARGQRNKQDSHHSAAEGPGRRQRW
eukprot:SAG22_NODE_5309_length_1040_cov_0.801275_3_plen_107_part_00